MTALSKTILEQYQIRKTTAQKDRFIALLKQHYPQLEIQQGGLLKSRNLIIGDVDRAKVILGAHYDTCARMPLPNFITPRNPLLSILYSLVILVPLVLATIVFNVVLGFLTDSFLIHYLLSLALFLAYMYLLMAGPANKNTANDNTSGVILLCQMLEQMTPDQLGKTAIVFFDNEELGLLGSSLFRSRFKKQIRNKLMINFDCIGDGDNILIARSKNARKHYDVKIATAFTAEPPKRVLFASSEWIYYPSDQAGFPRHIAVAALKHNRFFGYYMDRIHTKRDTVCNKENISLLVSCTQRLIDDI